MLYEQCSVQTFYRQIIESFAKYFHMSVDKFPFLFCCFVTRGRKPGSGRKNGGAGSKGKDKKLSGTESEQEVGIDLDTDVIICV